MSQVTMLPRRYTPSEKIVRLVETLLNEKIPSCWKIKITGKDDNDNHSIYSANIKLDGVETNYFEEIIFPALMRIMKGPSNNVTVTYNSKQIELEVFVCIKKKNIRTGSTQGTFKIKGGNSGSNR